MDSRLWLPLLALTLASCGGGETSAASAAVTPDEAAPAAAEPAAEPAAKPKKAAEPAAAKEKPPLTEAEKLAAAEKQRTGEAPRVREVLYKVTPEGLVIDVDGVRFKPRAEAVKRPDGGYGIRLTVEAEAMDDDTHVLLSPENGPLSLAVKVFDKSGKERAQHGDQRIGDEPQFIMPGGPLTLTREWPSGSVKGPLWWGEKVTLHVGLWGLGKANEKGRPMKKFFIVEMVGGAKPQAVLSPPEMEQ
jgi:hypothetical protein